MSYLDTNTATINEIDFTKYIKLSEQGSTGNSIKITPTGKGILTIYAASNSEDSSRTVKLFDSTGNTIEDFASDITKAESVTLPAGLDR